MIRKFISLGLVLAFPVGILSILDVGLSYWIITGIFVVPVAVGFAARHYMTTNAHRADNKLPGYQLRTGIFYMYPMLNFFDKGLNENVSSRNMLVTSYFYSMEGTHKRKNKSALLLFDRTIESSGLYPHLSSADTADSNEESQISLASNTP